MEWQVCALLAVINFIGSNAQICFGGFRPHSNFNPHRGSCGYVLGGHRRERGVFIRNFPSCCRRRAAQAWGFPNSCRSCMEVRGQAAPWSTWSSCSRTCGAGTQTRKRICNTRVCLGMRGRFDSQSRPCTWQSCCPVDGGWSSWTDSTECTASCGPGFQFRFRKCNSPAPSCGGKRCEGTSRLFRECIGQSCSAAEWGQWAPQGPCSATCGNGTFLRYRECYRPRGDVCEGPHEDHLPCNDGPCPHIPPEWCAWNDWSSCSSSCSDKVGTRKRTRVCACPAPSDSAEQCDGRVDEIDQCKPADPCPMDGSWGNWMSWSRCNAIPCSIAKGNQVRMRLCVDPPPKNGGRLCLGQFQDRRNCLNMDNCFVEGTYGNWSPWQQCSVTCGKCSKRSRTRRCLSPFVNPEIWEVDMVHGQPRLLCRSDRMQQTIPCHPPDCPDGTNPCKPASSPEKVDSVEPQSGQSTEVNGDAEMVPNSTRSFSATPAFGSATQASTSSTHAPQVDAEMESESLKVVDHVPTLSAQTSTRNSDSAISTGAGVVLEADSDALLSVTSHGSNKLVTSFPLASLKTNVNVDFAHSVDKDTPRISPEALTEKIGMNSTNTRNKRVSISQRQLTSEEFSRSSKDSRELQTETEPSTLPVDSVRKRIRTIATERSERRVTTVPDLIGERTKTSTKESVTKHSVRATELTTTSTVTSTTSDRSQQVRPTGQSTTVLLESTEKQPMSSSTQSVKDLESLISTNVLTKQSSTVLPGSITKETKTASRQVSEKRDSVVIRDFANEQKPANKQITTTSPDRSKDQVVTPASVPTVQTAQEVLPDLTLLNVEIAPISSALIEKEIATFSVRKSTQTAFPLRTLTEKSANDSVDDQTTVSVSNDSVDEQTTVYVSNASVDEQITVSRDVVDEQTTASQDVVNEQTAVSRDVVDEQTTVSQDVVNEKTTVSRDVVDEQTTVSQDVVNEQTTVSRDVVDEQTTVSQDVVNEQTTVSRDVVDKQTTVSQVVVNEKTTVAHDSVDELATVSHDVVDEQTTVSQDVVNDQTTVSRDVVDKQTVVLQDVVNEQTTISQESVHEQTTVPYASVDGQKTISRDSLNNAETRDFLKSVAKSETNSKPGIFDLSQDDVAVTTNAWNKPTRDLQDLIDEQTTVSSDYITNPSTFSTDSVKTQATVTPVLVNKQTTVSHDSVDQQSTMSYDSVKTRAAAARDSAKEQTTISTNGWNRSTKDLQDLVDEQTIYSSESAMKSSTVSPNSMKKQTTVSHDAVDQQTTVSHDSMDEQTTASHDSIDEQTTVSHDSMDEQTTVSSDYADEQTTVSHDSMDEQTTVSHDSMDEQTTVSHGSRDEQTTVSHDSMDEQTTVSHDSMDEQTTVSHDSMDEQTTVSHGSLGQNIVVSLTSADRHTAGSPTSVKPTFSLYSIKEQTTISTDLWNKPTKDLQDLVDEQPTVSSESMRKSSTVSRGSVKTQTTTAQRSIKEQTTISTDLWNKPTRDLQELVDEQPTMPTNLISKQTKISKNSVHRKTTGSPLSLPADSVKELRTVSNNLIEKLLLPFLDSAKEPTTSSPGSNIEQAGTSGSAKEEEQADDDPESKKTQTTISSSSITERAYALFDSGKGRKASSRFASASDDASQSNTASQDDLKDATRGPAKTLYLTYVSVVSYAVRVPETKLSDFLNAARSTGSNLLHIPSDPSRFPTVGKPKVAANYTTMRVTSTPEAATAVVQSLMRLDSSLGTKKKPDASVFDKPGGPTEFKNSAVAIDLTQPLSISSRAQEPEALHLSRKTSAQTEFTALDSGQSLHFAARTSDAAIRGTGWDGDVSRFAEKDPAFAIDPAEVSSFDTASDNTRDEGIKGQISVPRLISALYSTKGKSLETAGSGDLSVQESALQQQIKSLPAAQSREHQTAFLAETNRAVQVNVSQQLVQEHFLSADASLSSSRKENSLQSDLSISMPQKDKLKLGTMRGKTFTSSAGEAEVQPALETLKPVGTHGHLGAKGAELDKLHYIYDSLLPSSNNDPDNTGFEVLDGGISGAGSETPSDKSHEHLDHGGEDYNQYRASDNPPNPVDDPSSNNYPDDTGFEVSDRAHSGAGSETTSDESQEHPDHGGEDYDQYRAPDYPLNYQSNEYASGDYAPEYRDDSDESVLRSTESRKVDNCAELDNNDVTPQIEGCCRLVNNTQQEERSEEYLECMGLLFEKRFNVSPDFDVENSFDPRTTVSRCVCRKQKQLLKAVCCYQPFCRQWPKKLFRSLCNVCQPHCPPCFKPLLSG